MDNDILSANVPTYDEKFMKTMDKEKINRMRYRQKKSKNLLYPED